MKNILIIEPHADDALFSLFSIFSNKENIITVITCCTHEDGRSSKNLLKEISTVDQVYKLNWSENDYLWSSRNFTHHDINKLTSDNSYLWIIDKLKETHTKYKEDVVNLSKDLNELVLSLENEYVQFDEVYVPIGVVHPWHVLVSDACRYLEEGYVSIFTYYAERPYTHKKFTKKIQEDFMKLLLQEDNSYYSKELDYNGVEKEKLINKIYPGELQSFHWDRDKILELPEMIITK